MPAVTFTKALDVIKLISEGETVLQGCRKVFIEPAQFRAMVKKTPELATMLADAEETRDDILADKLVDLAELPSDPKQANVWSANVKFLLERRRPIKYGKVAENSNPDSEANRLLAAALLAAVDRIPQPPGNVPAKIIDATFSVVEPKKKASALPTPEVWEETSVGRETPIDGLTELKRLGLI